MSQSAEPQPAVEHGAPAAVVTRAEPPPVGWPFAVGFALAHIGAAFAFAPLLNLLIPLKVEAIDPARKQLLLSDLLLWGAVVAGVSNVVFGALSDATASRFGRRRPWIVAGLAGCLGSYVLLAGASSYVSLLAGLVAFQLFFNALYSPLMAVFPDRVPDRQKGAISGLIGIGYPVGAALGALAIGWVVGGTPGRYALIAAVLALTTGPFALRMRDPALHASGAGGPAGFGQRGRLGYRDFVFAWIARLMVQTAFFIAAAYGLFYLEDVVHYGQTARDARPEQGMATLILVCTLATLSASIVAGRLSDRVERRKVFVVAGACTVAAAMLTAGLGVDWGVAIAVWALLGAGMGVFVSVENALVAQVLPSARHAGRDLGVMNLGNTLPQCVAPGLAYLLLRGPHPDYRLFFSLGGGIALLGAVAILPVKSVR